MKFAVVSVLAAVQAIVAAPTPEANSEPSTNPAQREAHAPVRRNLLEREEIPGRTVIDFEEIEFESGAETEEEEEVPVVVPPPVTSDRGGRGGARGGGRGRGGRGHGGRGSGPRREGSPRRGGSAADTPVRTPDRTPVIVRPKPAIPVVVSPGVSVRPGRAVQGEAIKQCRLLSYGFSVAVDNDITGQSLANAIFRGPGLTVEDYGRAAALGSSGTFTDGPFGIGEGVILTTGQLSGALPGGDGNVDNGYFNDGGYNGACDVINSRNPAIIFTGVSIDPGYNRIRLEFIFATNEPLSGGQPDTISILTYGGGPVGQIATFDGQRINPQSSAANSSRAIFKPANLMNYETATYPLIYTILPDSDGYVEVFVAVCDVNNGASDSALLIKGYACVDCESTPDGPEINYVKQTSTLDPGEQPYTETIKALGTNSGTFINFVAAEETTTTTVEDTTTAEATTTTEVATETITTEDLTGTTTTEVPTETTETTETTTEISTDSTTVVDVATTTTDQETDTTTVISTEGTTTTAEVTDSTTTSELENTTEASTSDESTSAVESTTDGTTTALTVEPESTVTNTADDSTTGTTEATTSTKAVDGTSQSETTTVIDTTAASSEIGTVTESVIEVGDVFARSCRDYSCWTDTQCIKRGCIECNLYWLPCGDSYTWCY